MNYFYKLFIIAIIIFSSTQYSLINALTITSSSSSINADAFKAAGHSKQSSASSSTKQSSSNEANAITEWNLDGILNGNLIQSLQADSTNTDEKGRNLLHNGCHQSPCANRYGRWGHRERFNAWYEKYSQTPCPTPPTMEPTTAPTVAPTVSPTVSPTLSPTVCPTLSPTGSPTTRCALFDDFDGTTVNEEIWETEATGEGGVKDKDFSITVGGSSINFGQVLQGGQDGFHIRTQMTFQATADAPVVITGQAQLTGTNSDPYILISTRKFEQGVDFKAAEGRILFIMNDAGSANAVVIHGQNDDMSEDCSSTPLNGKYNFRVTIETDNVKFKDDSGNCPEVQLADSLTGEFYVYIGGDPDKPSDGSLQDVQWNKIGINCHEQ